MKKLHLILTTLFFVASCQLLPPKPPGHTITFHGVGEIKSTPDVANFVFTIRAEEKEVFLAQQKMAQKTNRALELLAKSGVEKRDIQTANYNTSPKYSYENRPSKPILTGFEATQTISLKLRNLAKSGEILSDIANLEIAEISGPNFAIENVEKLKSQAQAQAISKAKEEAATTAKNLGVVLKKIVGFNEEPQGFAPNFERGAMMMSAMERRAPQAAPQLEAGEEKIISRVAITYEIE